VIAANGVRIAAPHIIRGSAAAGNFLSNLYVRGSVAAGAGANYLGNQANQIYTRGQQTIQSIWNNPSVISAGNNPNALEFVGSVLLYGDYIN